MSELDVAYGKRLAERGQLKSGQQKIDELGLSPEGKARLYDLMNHQLNLNYDGTPPAALIEDYVKPSGDQLLDGIKHAEMLMVASGLRMRGASEEDVTFFM